MMFVVMNLHCARVDMRLKGVEGVGQGRQHIGAAASRLAEGDTGGVQTCCSGDKSGCFKGFASGHHKCNSFLLKNEGVYSSSCFYGMPGNIDCWACVSKRISS